MAEKKYLSWEGVKVLVDKIKALIPDTSKFSAQFNGTSSEWNALSDEEKAQYDSAAVDDMAGAGSMLTGVVEEGNENAVTSDAVAKAMLLAKNGDIALTTTSALTSGRIVAFRRGNVVVVTCMGVAATYGSNDTPIATGLPKAIKECYYFALDVNTADKRSLVISANGELKIGLGSVANVWQTIVYLTDE